MKSDLERRRMKDSIFQATRQWLHASCGSVVDRRIPLALEKILREWNERKQPGDIQWRWRDDDDDNG